MSSRLDQITNVVVILTSVAVVSVLGGQLWRQRQVKGPGVENVEGRNLHIGVAGAPAEGRLNAELTVVEFSDFQCPFCGRYARETWPNIRRQYVDTGRVRYVFRNLPLGMHPLAESAAESGLCANLQGKFWEFHQRLFANQQTLKQDTFAETAHALGLDDRAFAACLSGDISRRVAEDKAEASRLGVTATPSFFIGTTATNGDVKILRKIAGALPLDTFASAFDELTHTKAN
jgi:protein-disulfide isomerase